jgi:TrmH family RNA methyltransferase
VRSPRELPARTIALVARGGEPLEEIALTDATTIVVGAERSGLPDEVVAACDATATIPIAAESLNAAMAATVALYEIDRRMRRP